MADARRPSMTELIEQHAPLLYRYAYRLTGAVADAEDLVQQAFLLAHQRLNQLRHAGAARNWLLAIVRNVYLKSLRNRPVGRSLEEIEEPQTVETALDSLDVEQLQQALLELSEEFRSPLVLYYFEEFSYREIAEHMGVPLGTVMSRLARGKAYLKKRLTDHSDHSHRAQHESTEELTLQH